jgi:hypothetical protein
VVSKTTAGLIALVVVAALSASCGSGGSSSSSGGSIRSALGSVRDGPDSERFFAWADGAELRKLSGVSAASGVSGVKARQTWVRLAEVAAPAATGVEPQLAAATGIDPYAANRVITIGVAPDRATRLDGVDTGTILRRFRQLGAREQTSGGHTYLEVADQGQLAVSNPRLADDIYLALNRVYVNGSTAAFGLADPPVDTVLGGGRSLADAPAYAAVADCLGDAFVAQVAIPAAGAPSGVSLVGFGVRRPTSANATVTEVLCEVTGGKDQAGQLAATIAGRVGPSVALPGTALRVGDRVAQASVDQVTKGDEHLVRLTAGLVTPARAGFLALDAPPAALAFLEGGASGSGG